MTTIVKMGTLRLREVTLACPESSHQKVSKKNPQSELIDFWPCLRDLEGSLGSRLGSPAHRMKSQLLTVPIKDLLFLAYGTPHLYLLLLPSYCTFYCWNNESPRGHQAWSHAHKYCLCLECPHPFPPINLRPVLQDAQCHLPGVLFPNEARLMLLVWCPQPPGLTFFSHRPHSPVTAPALGAQQRVPSGGFTQRGLEIVGM